jgi:hypothetical protein
MKNLKAKGFIALFIVIGSFFGHSSWASKLQNEEKFNFEKDLLIVNFDCKTDVDDVHSAAALKMMLSSPQFKKVKYHAVAGTYGIQEGLYVPPNDLFELSFGKNWTDAHSNREIAVEKVKIIALKILSKNGNIWIAEAGQSDFSAALIAAILVKMPSIDLKSRIHVVQHSNWNEEVTSKEALTYVKNTISYHKIADGNVVGNGTPGFRTPGYTQWKEKTKNKKLLEIWSLAVQIGEKYNGKEGRYNNQAISQNGLDFSDLSEVCWILGKESIKDTDEFFDLFGSFK